MITTIPGKAEVEAVKQVNSGDKIVTGELGKRYVITQADFNKLYYLDPENAEIFISRNTVNALVLEKPLTLKNL